MPSVHNFSESGNRIRFIRHLTGKSRQYFSEKYDLSPSTLRAWETSKVISKKAAIRVCDTFSAEGVLLDINWIYGGQGDMPTLEKVTLDLDKNISYEEDINIIQDLFSFKERHKDSVDAIVLNSELEPLCYIGNYVAGVPIKTNLEILENKLCIVVSDKGGKYIGLLSKFNEAFVLKNTKQVVIYKIGNRDLIYKVTLVRGKA